ncbi:PucR family transcriptional regulator [Pseudonocardia zijingensis]|jgi:DNA-binding PucR family transcriptional regulator|uniref:Helix-turn-helix domain-containing protein n=1 Tax=Pseudonocardia zijingensis TaxID=153376 RepID=A0ABN1PHL7_9PSEU
MDTTLRRLLAAIGEPLVELAAAPSGLDVPLTGLAILDPDDEPDRYPGQLVLVIGVRGRAATPALRAAARRGAAAVAVKAGGPVEVLRAAAADAGAALLLVRPDVRWERVESLARDVLHEGGAAGDDGSGDLYSLAQTVALLTHGVVSIEDTASRVLAYSRSDADAAQVDELRRLSILGRQGPAEYLRLLREWGVFDRLRDSEDVVHVDEHAELGIRRRLAIGIHAGPRQLGTIWVQEGAEPFAERAADVLVGAARVAAGHLVRRRSQQSPGGRWERDLVAGLLDGRASPDLVAGTFGLNEDAGALVVAFAVREGDAAAHELVVAELVEVVSVHAAAHRRTALCAAVGARVYAVLPDVHATDAVRTLSTEVVGAAGRRSGIRVQAGIGSPAERLSGVPDSRREADRVLDAMAEGQDVAVFGEIRAEVLLTQTLGLLAANPDLRDPGVARLVEYDREHRTDLVASVVAWLDAMGDVRAAADRLTVHPNTLRYRVRRATAIAGLRLDEPRTRLVHHLQLLAVSRNG